MNHITSHTVTRQFYAALLSITLALLILTPFTTVPLQAQGSTCDDASGVLIGTLATGLNCVDDSGLQPFELKSGSILTVSSLDDVAVCPETGQVLALHIFGMSVFEDGSWSDFEVPSDVFAPNALACAPNGDIWIAHMSGVSYYDGSDWITFADDQFGSSPFILGVDDIAAGVDGSVWAATSASIARYTGDGWEVFENGKGFNEDFPSLGQMVLNSDGLPTVVYSGGLLRYDGSDWTTDDAPITSLQNIVVDATGRTWVGSLSEGVAVLTDDEWVVYNTDNGLSSNKIHALAADDAGRVWVGTEWGLNVLDGDQWFVYQMSNSDLADNNVQFISTLGTVTELPAAQDKEPGSVVGVIEMGREPVADAQVELCTESLGGVFYGLTPCEDQPGHLITTTDENGEFVFENVPVGRYDISIGGPDGWIYFVGVDTKVIVEAGEETDLADIDISN